MKRAFDEMNQWYVVRHATGCLLTMLIVVMLARIGVSSYQQEYTHDVTQQGFKIENTKSPLRTLPNTLPWLNESN